MTTVRISQTDDFRRHIVSGSEELRLDRRAIRKIPPYACKAVSQTTGSWSLSDFGLARPLLDPRTTLAASGVAGTAVVCAVGPLWAALTCGVLGVLLLLLYLHREILSFKTLSHVGGEFKIEAKGMLGARRWTSSAMKLMVMPCSVDTHGNFYGMLVAAIVGEGFIVTGVFPTPEDADLHVQSLRTLAPTAEVERPDTRVVVSLRRPPTA